MNVFTSRDDLLGYISSHIVYKYVRRAIMDDGLVENYGAFAKPVREFDEPGWLVKITTSLGRTVYVAVICQEQYRLVVTEREPMWEHWAGADCDNALYHGDHPDHYIKLKEHEDVKTKG